MLTAKRKEKLSAFLDNDMHQDELMSFSLSAEADDAAQAQRYQLVGDALRGEMSESSFVDVSVAVREALANENIANENIADQFSAEQSSAQQSSRQQTEKSVSTWSLSSIFKPVAGMAIAASVAVVMVVTVNQQDNAGLAPIAENTQQQPVLQFADVQQASDKLAGSQTNTAKSVVAVSGPSSDVDAKVNQRLLKQHLEFATQDTLQGRLPYVRAVSFEPEK